MTNERAIELLNRISDSQFDGIHGDERREALEMAVRALESNLVKESGNLVQDLVKDCISRKAAIDAFEPEHDTDWYTPQIIEVLEALPPVHPTQTNADSTHENTLDCVSRQAAIDVCNNAIDLWHGQLGEGIVIAVKKKIEELPSTQPEIIQCKDCKHRDPEDHKCDCGHDIIWQLPRDDKWYCADAERRTDGIR